MDEMEDGRGDLETPSVAAPRAAFWQRLVATIVDGIAVSIIIFLAARVMGIQQPDIRDPEAQALGANYFLSAATGFMYFTLLEGGRMGQTWGKRVIGIRVADISTGRSIGVPRALIRHVGRFLSTLPLLLGYLWMLWDPEKQTWHDKLARAVVIENAD